jgi:hypothetical protein
MIWTRLACQDRANVGDYGVGRARIQFPGSVPKFNFQVQFPSFNSHVSILKFQFPSHHQTREIEMAKGEQKSNREQKKPKKEKIKVVAAAPSQKPAAWQPGLASGKKK